MGTTARPNEVEKMFERFNDYLDQENIEGAKKMLDQLRDLLGNHDNGVVSASVALDLWQD